jgi:hypothetical protein
MAALAVARLAAALDRERASDIVGGSLELRFRVKTLNGLRNHHLLVFADGGSFTVAEEPTAFASATKSASAACSHSRPA